MEIGVMTFNKNEKKVKVLQKEFGAAKEKQSSKPSKLGLELRKRKNTIKTDWVDQRDIDKIPIHPFDGFMKDARYFRLSMKLKPVWGEEKEIPQRLNELAVYQLE